MFVFVHYFGQLSYFNKSNRVPLWTVKDEIWGGIFNGQPYFHHSLYDEDWEVENRSSVSGV